MLAIKKMLRHLTHAEAYWIYYDERAQALLRKPHLTRRDLVYVSGRDYRVWDEEIFGDMIRSYVETLGLSKQVSILEVGCAGGLLGSGLSPHVREYIGVDPAPNSLRIGRRLNLPNARFLRGTAGALPVPDGSVERVVCADVFVNIGDLTLCHQFIAEMARVVADEGKILVATMNDGSVSREAFTKRVQEYAASLPPYEEDPEVVVRKWMPWRHKVLYKIRRQVAGAIPPQPPIITHDPQFFVDTGKQLGMTCEILPVHERHPYRGFRFNALFTKLKSH